MAKLSSRTSGRADGYRGVWLMLLEMVCYGFIILLAPTVGFGLSFVTLGGILLVLTYYFSKHISYSSNDFASFNFVNELASCFRKARKKQPKSIETSPTALPANASAMPSKQIRV